MAELFVLPDSLLGPVALRAVALLVVYQIAVVAYRLWFHPLSGFPGPKYFASSNIPFRYRSHIQGRFFKTVEQLHVKYGPVVRIAPNALAVDGVYAWESIYTHKSGVPEWSKVTGHFFPGDHMVLINAPLETHRRQRRAIAPAFSNLALHEQETRIINQIRVLLRALTESGTGEGVDILKWFYLLTMDTVSELIFSDSFNSLKDKRQQEYMLGFFESTQGLQLGSFLSAFPLLNWLLPVAYMADIGGLRSSRKYGLFIESKAKARIASGLQPGQGRDFISYMKQHQDRPSSDDAAESGTSTAKGMSDVEISLNSLILATSGSDATTTTMCGVLYHLAQGLGARARTAVVHEIRRTFANEEEISLDSTTATSLPFLNACLEETMRLYPSTPEQPPRVSPGAVVGDRFIPRGTRVYTFQWSTNRNPANFNDAHEFHPERFLPKSHHLYDSRFQDDQLWLVKPFSHGPRDCVGRNLAYAIMRLTLAHFLYRFDYELLDASDDWIAKQTVKFAWTKSPLRIRLKLRAGSHTSHDACMYREPTLKPRPPQERPHRPLRVLCLGLPRTGTTTLAAALRILGLQDVHQGSTMPWKDFDFFDHAADASFTDLPSYNGKCGLTREEWDTLYAPCEAVAEPAGLFAQQLLRVYPEAKVINTIRPYEVWAASFDAAILRPLFPPLVPVFLLRFVERFLPHRVWSAIHKTVSGKFGAQDYKGIKTRLRAVYDEHQSMLKNSVPAEKLLDFDVQEGWGPLCQFLGAPIPDAEFPRANDRREMHFKRQREVWRNTKTVLEKSIRGILLLTSAGVALWAVSRSSSKVIVLNA
ncbi:hypothetical protein AC578_989 [Pseudocercospora eumusae]|uniref:Cytochrome P450 n=1 Tax=Pseudocercospora eumusae TaxID=321146 RepID=A0A139GTT4_9PEZI|nr:hypothetical protein AC578_989 [Pseudocercospora eumusae]